VNCPKGNGEKLFGMRKGLAQLKGEGGQKGQSTTGTKLFLLCWTDLVMTFCKKKGGKGVVHDDRKYQKKWAWITLHFKGMESCTLFQTSWESFRVLGWRKKLFSIWKSGGDLLGPKSLQWARKRRRVGCLAGKLKNNGPHIKTDFARKKLSDPEREERLSTVRAAGEKSKGQLGKFLSTR